ncbi:MAG: phosphatidate cytidylyltransferase [Elusimicrobia bacterium]|nr:phosphatidate cytidylyltransferase [Elusimicrobiota bacterium]
MLLPRVLTAVVGIPAILLAIHLGGLSFIIFVLGLGLFCLYEAFQLFGKMEAGPRKVLGYGLGIVLFALFIFPSHAQPKYAPLLGSPSLLGLGLTIAIVFLTLVELFHIKTRSFISSAVTLFAVLLVMWPLAHLVLLRDLVPLGKQWCLFLFVTIWVSDTFAYFIGLKLGRRKLAPRVSPKKTIEGFLGGVVGAALAASLMWVIFFRSHGLDYGETAVLGGLGIGVLGQLSDLVESVLKRQAKVKDSGDILPGHGGFLDRFDSFLLTAPLLYYYVILRW